MNGARLAALLLALAAIGAPTGAATAGPHSDWRSLVTIRDGQRLRDWRKAWTIARADALGGGGAATIAADRALFDPDAALVDRVIPAQGDYRCRRITMGARLGGAALAVEPWGRCRIEGQDAPLQLTGLDGIQRAAGLIYADTDRRAIFLGTTMFPDDHRWSPYGHAAGRDMAGVVERIGEHRWRLVLPYPHFGGSLDMVELVPAS